MHEPGGKGASHRLLPGQGLLGQIQGGSGSSVKSPKLKKIYIRHYNTLAWSQNAGNALRTSILKISGERMLTTPL